MFLREVEGRDEGIRSSRETTHIGFAPGGAGTTPLNSTDLLFLVTVSDPSPSTFQEEAGVVVMTQREFILDRHVSSLVDVDSVLSSGTRRRREGNEGECGAAPDDNQTGRTMLPRILPTLLASDQTVIPVAG